MLGAAVHLEEGLRHEELGRAQERLHRCAAPKGEPTRTRHRRARTRERRHCTRALFHGTLQRLHQRAPPWVRARPTTAPQTPEPVLTSGRLLRCPFLATESVRAARRPARPGHVKLAERMERREPGTGPVTGDRVPFVVVRERQRRPARNSTLVPWTVSLRKKLGLRAWLC